MNKVNSALVKILPLVPRSIVRKFANRYIAGDSLVDAVELTRKLNDNGIMSTLDVLGEFVTTETEAAESKIECIEALEAIDKHKLDSNLSLKLTQLGLKIDFDFCLNNLIEILNAAKSFKRFVRIDMEDSSCTDDTFSIVSKAREFYPDCGFVVQAYLRRTFDDVKRIIDSANSKVNFRLCKGIYVEPEEIAFKKKEEINRNFLKSLRLMLENNCYVGIATHDESLVSGAYQMINELKKKKSEYEFQMLLGVKEGLRDKILRDGHRLRIYIPYGKNWYGYSIRRFKENPQIAGYILKSLFTRR
ncbi:MAG: proline dehydrogenase family protein [Ignavibacteria bacterium]